MAMAFTWHFLITALLSGIVAECGRINTAAVLQMQLSTAGVAEPNLQELAASALGNDCKFRGADYRPELLCNRIRSAFEDREDCGFSAVSTYLSGKDCPNYCTAMRAILKEKDAIPCESIEPALRVMSLPNPFDCSFKGNPYAKGTPYSIEKVCERVKSSYNDEECGFDRIKSKLVGRDCAQLCMKVREATASEPTSSCDIIAWHVHANENTNTTIATENEVDVQSESSSTSTISPSTRTSTSTSTASTFRTTSTTSTTSTPRSLPSQFDCSFKGRQYAIEKVCERVKGSYNDEKCGFDRISKLDLVGRDCAQLCIKVREAIASEPTSPCDSIARHVHTNANTDTTSTISPSTRTSTSTSTTSTFSTTSTTRTTSTTSTTSIITATSITTTMIAEPEVRFHCNKVWIMIEGDNSNGLNIRMGSQQFARLMEEDLGWNTSCAIVLVNQAETKINGEFAKCRHAHCVKSSILQFSNLPRLIGQNFPGAEKIFLMFNDHGEQFSGLVFPGARFLKRSSFLATVQEILELHSVKSMFVLVDACFSGSMFGDAQVQIKDATGGNVSYRTSHGGDAESDVVDLVRKIGEDVGKDIMAFASSIPQLACMEAGMRGGLFSWSYMNALDALLTRYVDESVDFTFGDIIDSTWEQMPPLLPKDVEATTFRYIDPATQNHRTQRQPSSIRGSAQTFFPMSFGTMSGKSAAQFFCAGLDATSSCGMRNRNPLSSRCESSTAVASKEACLALNKLPDEDPRGQAPVTKQCNWSGEYETCLPWVKAHAYMDKFKSSSSRDRAVTRCSGGSCKLT